MQIETSSPPDQQLVRPRSGKDLFDATIPFGKELPLRGWWHVGSTLILLSLVLTVAATAHWLGLRCLASILGSLLLVRTFILYHDFMHGSLLSGSRPARAVFYVLGSLMLAPPRHWRYSHNFHHAHVGEVIVAPDDAASPLLTSDVGTFPLMCTEQWRRATPWERLCYRVSRHPLSILFAYVTIFLIMSCIAPIFKNPRKYWDGFLSAAAHGGLIAALWLTLGFSAAFFGMILPFGIASALGAYLFYAQHTYEGLKILPAEEWTYFEGAVESSSYMKLDPVMDWFTGNIGYHHVHHLNPQIPFYRLAEAMAAIPELQNPVVTTLGPRDVIACFRANLWEASTQRMVSYREADLSAETAS